MRAEVVDRSSKIKVTRHGNSSRQGLTACEKLLLLIFLLSLPLANPWVRGDGVGYYAFARAMIIGHNLDFRPDWLAANASFRMGRVDAKNQVVSAEYTATGHLDNHFSIGPAILWAPFLTIAHAGVLLWDKAGGHVAASGYSPPYLWTMAVGTAIYGFLALWISFRIACRYFSERWALLGTLGIWFGSSLPVYMYFNPSWAHAQSAFTVALFVWYWDGTRDRRRWTQWAILGLIGGLMMDVYYIAGIALALPAIEMALEYRESRGAGALKTAAADLGRGAVLAASAFVAFLPTLISKKIIYGHWLGFGYQGLWNWRSTALLKVLFSADHGLLSWTPIIALALVGLALLRRNDWQLATILLAVFGAYLYAMGCYQDWNGISSFGNRFFVSLTPLFVVGLAAFFQALSRFWSERRSWVISATLTCAFAAWNCGLIFQWGTHLIPARGPISWRAAALNQVAVVPGQAAETIESYMTGRKKLMERIEQTDVRQLQDTESKDPE